MRYTSRMALHPQAATFLERQRRAGVRPDHQLSIAQVRARADEPAEDIEPVAAVENTTVPGPAGPVPLHVYTPRAAAVGVVVHLHGGGHVTGTLDSYDGHWPPSACPCSTDGGTVTCPASSATRPASTTPNRLWQGWPQSCASP